ncbi:MAG: hypothetical protein ACK48V_04860 [Crocinitomicaceae bacterium]|jgi:hypothetical protein
MKTLLKKIMIEKIEFQSNVNEVTIKCIIKVNELSYHNELVINFSQLNKLVGKIQQLSQFIDIYSFFKETKINEIATLYTLEGTAIELDAYEFEEVIEINQTKKISA